jgi:outer membrane protein TolC
MIGPKSSWTRATALTLGLFLVLPGGVLSAQEPPAMSLEQAIEAALRHSPLMAQAEGAVLNAESGERSALGAYLPSLSLRSGSTRSSATRYNQQTATIITGAPAVNYTAGLSSSIDLFTGFRRGAESNRAHAQTTAAEAGLVQQRFQVVLTTKRAFFDVLRADELIRVSAARVERAQEGLDAAKRRSQVGSSTQSDVLRSQLELNNARQALAQAENQQRSATYALGRLVGATGAVGARSDGSLDPRPLNLDREALAQEVLRQAPAVRAAEASSGSADASARAARAQYLPTVSASAGYDFSNRELAIATGTKSWSLGVSLSYPLFNRFQREDNVGRANVAANIARTQLEDARRTARAELERILGSLELAEQQVELTEEAVRVAEEDMRVQQERYRLGVSTILDQVTSQANLVQAEVNRITARYDYQTARAELEALLGREL